MENNYLQLHSCWPFYRQFVFVDTVDHFYAPIMKRNSIMPRGIKEYVKAGSPYRLIACKVKNSDTFLFSTAIRQIRNKALLLGYSDYDEVCRLMHQVWFLFVNRSNVKANKEFAINNNNAFKEKKYG